MVPLAITDNNEGFMEVIEPANIEDVDVLTEITKSAKAYWGYSEKDLLEWDKQLTITEDYLQESSVYKLVSGNLIAGYYAFLFETENTIRIDYFFVSPKFMGKGFGSKLLDHLIKSVITNINIKTILVDADPNAQGFYENFGFKKVREIKSSIKGRFLPVMKLEI